MLRVKSNVFSRVRCIQCGLFLVACSAAPQPQTTGDSTQTTAGGTHQDSDESVSESSTTTSQNVSTTLQNGTTDSTTLESASTSFASASTTVDEFSTSVSTSGADSTTTVASTSTSDDTTTSTTAGPTSTSDDATTSTTAGSTSTGVETSTTDTTLPGTASTTAEDSGAPEPVCGNGVQEVSEACDDGNQSNEDGCLNTCENAACGDGYVQQDVEACDDGNAVNGDGCQTNCRITFFPQELHMGSSHLCLQSTDGRLRCWGRNNYGQLGYGSTTSIGWSTKAWAGGDVQVGGAVMQTSTGAWHTCVILDGGFARCWGRNNYGQLGYGSTTNIGDTEYPYTAGDISVGGEVTQLSAGGEHTCAVLEGGDVRCWGRNNYGQLGLGHTNDIGDNESPSAAGVVSVGGSVAQLSSAHGYHTVALLDIGGARGWGDTGVCQLGYKGTAIGDNEVPSSQPLFGFFGEAVRVSAGSYNSCVITSQHEVYCWGWNLNGELGQGEGQFSVECGNGFNTSVPYEIP